MKPLFGNIFLAIVLAASVGGSFVHGQSLSEDSTNHGVIVSFVEKHSDAAEASLQVGDRILTWEQGLEGGKIHSPFDFRAMTREQAPRGPVTLHGKRLGVDHSWVLKTDDFIYEVDSMWGVKVVGGWPDATPVIQQMQAFDRAKKYAELAEYCRLECDRLNPEVGERSYANYLAASLLLDANHPRESDEFIQRAMAERPDGPSYVAVALYEKESGAKWVAGDWASAAHLLEEATREIGKLRSPSLYAAYTLTGQAVSELMQSNYRNSAQFARRALAITNLLAPHSLLNAHCSLTLGQAAMHGNDLETADKFTRKGLALAEAIRPNSNFVAEANNAAGEVAWRRGDIATAEIHFSTCIRIMSKLGTNPGTLLGAMEGLARVNAERGNPVMAERFIARFMGVLERHGDWAFLGDTLLNLAGLKLQYGESAEAARYARQALDMYKRAAPDGPFLNLALFVYADALRQQGQLNNAEQTFSQLQSRLEAGKGDSREAAFYHYGVGELYSQRGDYDRAKEELQSAIEILRLREPRSPYYALLLGTIAKVEEHKGDLQAAMAHYSEAIRLTDSLSVGLERSASIHFLIGRAEFSARYAGLLLSRGRLAQAFAVLDHAHAQTLMRTLSANKVNLRRRAPRDLQLKDRKLESQLSELSEQRVRALTGGDKTRTSDIDKKIAEATTDHDLVEAQLRAADQGYALLTQPTPPSLRLIQSRLDADTALLEYALDKDGSLMFALDRNRLVSFRLKGSAELDKLARAVYTKFSRSGQAKATDTVEFELSDAILGPAAGFIKGHRKLLIVADGSLQYVPFAALPSPRALSAVGPFMGSAFEISNLPSASFLGLPASANRQGQGSKSIAVLADPVFTKDDPRVGGEEAKQPPVMTASRGGDTAAAPGDGLELVSREENDSHTRGVNLSRLLFSREEAEAIEAVSPKQDFFMAADFNANRATALNPQVTGSRIIHFATHGIFDSKNPAMSGLVFSLVDKQGKPQPGFLGLDDIYRLRLSADLVVMSACETALGEEVKGEGLVGLTWSFIYAGAKSVVASLWRVNDASTAELMHVFYTGIEREGLTPAAALHKAQLAIAGTPRWSAPYYWAGFVIEGQPAK